MPECYAFTRNKLIRAGVVSSAGALTLLLSGCGGTEEDTCTSPRVESSVYPGDPTADPVLQSTWKTGIEVVTDLPANTDGLIVSYRPPNAAEWTDESEVVPTERAKSIALRIGQDSVVFSTQLVAERGSPACETAPDSTFSSPQPFDELLRQDATLPNWGN